MRVCGHDLRLDHIDVGELRLDLGGSGFEIEASGVEVYAVASDHNRLMGFVWRSGMR